jgi:hypothetical protein
VSRVAASGNVGSWREAGTRARESLDSAHYPWFGKAAALAMSFERESRHGA